MAVKVWLVAMVALLSATTACGRGTEPAEAKTGELDSLVVTRWSDKTELFAEYPPLVVGQTSRFAIHLTDLRSFKAVTAGRVEVQLRGEGAPETFRVDGPSRPGIFGVDVKPSRPGNRVLVIALKSPGLADEHQVPDVIVHDDQQAARKAAESAPAEDEGISFLKEQQWTLDFGTSLAEERVLRESIRVPAAIIARPGGWAEVVAPVDGRLMQVASLGPGSPVKQGQELARLLPPPSVPGELPQLEQARAEATAAVELAARDRERALDLDRHQAVTLASIVESETGVPSERSHVAAVTINRLREGWKLEADPTVRYGLGLFTGRLYYKHLDEDTPYITYRVAGLPPGPIGSPGRDALQAVLEPLEPCDDFFFVASGDGGHVFSETKAAHDRAVAEYRSRAR
jgi:hypothetical protein